MTWSVINAFLGNSWHKPGDDSDLKSKLHQNSDQIYDPCEASNSARELTECLQDTRLSKGDSKNNLNISSSITSKNKKQEVSRKGNGIDVSGWKSQFCMNGISFCFKVGTLLRPIVSVCHLVKVKVNDYITECPIDR